ncbi:phosphate ABC transporter substrate-binding protein [Thermoleophilum album]|uniref:Phosphate transport system substrate-binding protein n=1 Tax=Thermoleophilum album TaxID=29539 RepID=A0A1H6FIE0_THEAL|nr:phosphate ABC transporter substrate-binding protein [Thermoleophilum album]SEH10182.1 phosphate transport system substrate-binding protein [Thermoleophilum album]
MRIQSAAAVGVGALAFAAAAPAGALAKPTITMSGSTSVAPLAAKLARAYLRECRGCVRFKLLQGGSDVGISDVARGRVTIGNSSRDPKPGDPGGLVFNKIARDAICIITNPANRLPNLSQAQVQAIFSGSVRDWRQVPGSTISGPIDLFVRTPASGTQDAFDKIFMKPQKVSTVASQKASNGLIQQAVQRDRNGIGYVSLDFTRGVHTVRYKGVACTLRNAVSGQYEGVRNFYMVTRGKPTGAAARFIRWVQRSTTARRVIATDWVPLR